jgi:hypothetical protein
MMCTRERGMWPQRCMALPVLAILFFPATAWTGYCDMVFRWDDHAIDACIRELKSEIETLQLQLQTERGLNQVMRGNLCLLANELKTEHAAEIAEIACAELREKAAAKKKPGGPKKP